MPVKLISADGQDFDIPWKHLSQLRMVKNKLEDLGFGEHDEVKFPVDVNSVVLKMVIDWAKAHEDDSASAPEEKGKTSKPLPPCPWDKEMLDIVDPGTLFELIVAANRLEAKGLLDITLLKCQSWMQGREPEQLRLKFEITNDFTTEEVKQIEMENKWCQESK